MSRNRPRRTLVLFVLASLAVFVSLAPMSLRAQDDGPQPPEKHGRKYKAPPETSHIEVTVLKDFNKKPIDGAHVILHPVKDGKDEGNLEIKTHQDGKVAIDVIPTGSKVTIQVFADGFATFAQDYQINEASRQIVISVVRPRAQVSTYVDNQGKPAQMKPGVQEPVRPKPAAGAGSSSGSPATPNASSSGTKPQN
jgi:hypothetical protein